jgi:sarcosine oxidase/L-pipecolate oxidase
VLPEPALDAIKQFVSIFMPEFENTPFYSTKLCWYTDSLDNSFVVSTEALTFSRGDFADNLLY